MHTEFGKDSFTALESQDANYLFKLACKSEFDKLNDPQYSHWSCQSCTFQNSGTDHCAICETKNTSVKKQESAKDKKAKEVALSVKYQVLCDETSLIGVVK